MVNENIDFLIAERILQIGFQANGGEEIALNDFGAFDEQINIAAAGQIIGARAKEEDVGVRSKTTLDGLANEVTFLSGEAHAVAY